MSDSGPDYARASRPGSGGDDLTTAVHRALLPTPRATDGTKGGPNQRGSSGDLMLPSAVHLLPTPVTDPASGNGHARDLAGEVHLLPTPAVNDMGASYTPEAWDEWTDAMKAKHGNGNGHGKSLAIEAQRMLPTPTSTDAAVRQVDRWGDYAAAITRWEAVLGRPAPDPTEVGAKGRPRLSPAFVEWMMGLPAGHITDVPGLTRNEQLKALGNGVVPQQAALALRAWLATRTPRADEGEVA